MDSNDMCPYSHLIRMIIKTLKLILLYNICHSTSLPKMVFSCYIQTKHLSIFTYHMYLWPIIHLHNIY